MFDCSKCAGTGRVACERCDGTRYIECDLGYEHDCSDCMDGKNDCEYCHGAGSLACRNCREGGDLLCPTCVAAEAAQEKLPMEVPANAW